MSYYDVDAILTDAEVRQCPNALFTTRHFYLTTY